MRKKKCFDEVDDNHIVGGTVAYVVVVYETMNK